MMSDLQWLENAMRAQAIERKDAEPEVVVESFDNLRDAAPKQRRRRKRTSA
jgi:hypothetical protein